ncbi:MAG: tetratricopeptide repeat protein [Candidatus Omnitrophica bacterium]|nr:tetratricopeptide repeat protein [Candidatus Omnitrophota bacterium]
MSRRRVCLRVVGGVVALGLLAALAPIGILWCPGAASWRAHSYRRVLYTHLATRIAQGCRSTPEVIDATGEYVQTHLWPAVDVVPYDGKPLSYLVNGIGWCDYMAKVYMRLLAVHHIPARYAMLREAGGGSPHTVAEVWYRNRWGVHDVLFGIRFTDAQGEPLTLEELSRSPELLEAQSPMRWLRQEAVGRTEEIRELYGRVLPVPMPPRRSHAGTARLTPFDRVLMRYVAWGGQPFVDWYQDRYLASSGVARPSTPEERLTLARHWHMAGRRAIARRAYERCLREGTGSPAASDARFWLGLLHWELEADAVAALQTFETLLADNPNSHWRALAWYYMGRCEEALGRAGQAQVWYTKALGGGVVTARQGIGG